MHTYSTVIILFSLFCYLVGVLARLRESIASRRPFAIVSHTLILFGGVMSAIWFTYSRSINTPCPPFINDMGGLGFLLAILPIIAMYFHQKIYKSRNILTELVLEPLLEDKIATNSLTDNTESPVAPTSTESRESAQIRQR